MKILNQTYRKAAPDEVLNKTPVSELPATSELKPESLIHIVQYIDNNSSQNRYESMKMTIDSFENKVYEAVQNTFKVRYWNTHCDEGSSEHSTDDVLELCASFTDMVKFLENYDGWKMEEPDWESYEWKIDGFVKHINYDFEILRRYVVLNDNLIREDISDIKDRLLDLECMFEPNMKLTTRDENGEVTSHSVMHDKTENDFYCQMKIEVGNKISNKWTCPETGNLVIYGWLDSSSALNNKAIASAYCVLEANINANDENGENWEVISVQPVIPAKNITYVGFNVPVRKNLVIRIRTGFTVGAKSGQFANDQDGYDTLSNSEANGFRCMVFSNIN